ncbi:type VII secretion protein EssA [Mesobacillus zeae]|uniref:Type VII secretion protein EssA n=1 Tax=Mesobacillus zeae TaxID=1917180 RepID=A0A398B1Z2_9BACI|nr:type VII secretion protein EssA [Mesobacillus zeae]RID81903.1 type VII secretion protein EssA [Mesobacillus zeae]
MKRNLAIKLILLLIFLSLGPAFSARAETGIEDLTPNEYKQREFKKNTELLHEKSLTEKKVQMSELQRGLKLSVPKDDSYNDVISTLFEGSKKESNTITAKAEQLKLFSSENKAALSDKKNKILEEQLKTVFSIKPKKDSYNEVLTSIFTSNNMENNTITAKAKELKLFSGDASGFQNDEEENADSGLANKGVIITLAVLLLLFVIVLFALLIPKMVPGGIEEPKK